MASITLTPTRVHWGGYEVSLDGTPIGYVYRPRAHIRSEWAYSNEPQGWYGTVRTQRAAIQALVELATRREA